VITGDGIAALGAWWEAVPADDPPPRDELLLKVLMAIDQDPDHALRVITRQRSVLVSVLQAKRRERRDAAAAASAAAASDPEPGSDTTESLAAALVTEALVARAEADLRWLDTCEAQLQQRQPSDRKGL
jgi:hypothetical protein